MNINDLRRNYKLKKLDESDLMENPAEMFLIWFQEALDSKIEEPNAAALATATKAGIVSCRMILIKHVDEGGFVFFTNYGSRKSHELEENPNAALDFYWKELERQICIEGKVEKVSHEESETYFAKRPRESQISAWASKQGDILKTREELDNEFAKYEKEFTGKNVPLPPYWGGFRLVPERVEFWQGRENRLHDRFSYTLEGSAWRIERLSP